MPGMPDSVGLVNLWHLEPTGDHCGRLRDAVTQALGTFTRATPRTVYDPSTGRIHDVSAGCIAAIPFAGLKAGGRGWAYSIEEARTNSYVRSAFDLDTNGDGLSDGWTFATGATGTRTAGSVYGTRQTVSYVGGAGDVNATVKLISQDGLTGVATNNVTTSSYRVSASSGVTAVQRFIEAHDAAHAVLGTFAVAITDTAAITRGSGTYSNLPVGTTHVCSGVRATGVDAGDTVTIGMEAAMNEVGAFLSSYVYTGVAAATRNADALTVPTTGWDASKGTWVVVVNDSLPSTRLRVLTWQASDGLHAVYLWGDDTPPYSDPKMFVTANATNFFSYPVVNSAKTTFTAGGKWAVGAPAKAYLDGSASLGSGNVSTPPVLSAAVAYVGAHSLTVQSNSLFGPLAIYSLAKTDAEVAAISTAMENGYTRGNRANDLLLLLT